MSISTDLSSALGQMRLLLGDNIEGAGVRPDGTNFSDAELSYFHTQGGGVLEGAALACDALAQLWTLQPSFEADGLRVERGTVAAGWRIAAQGLRARAGAKTQRLIRSAPAESGDHAAD